MPMWPALLALLKEKNIVEQSNDGTWGALNGSLILSILNSPVYLSMCPKVRISEAIKLLVFESSKHSCKHKIDSDNIDFEYPL